MAVSTWSVRVNGKYDTSAEWTRADPVLLRGEVITVVTSSGELRHKTGDGTKRYTQLPFDDEAVRNLVNGKNSVAVSASTPAGQAANDLWYKPLT